MILDVDTIIFTGFLAINLIVGLFYSRNVKSTSEYAIGKRDFSTSTLTTTIIATAIGAGIFSITLAESYRQGLYFIIPVIFGESCAIAFTGYFIAPRMVEFYGTLSVAEAMNKLYGRSIRIITAISGITLCIGAVALQFKVAGVLIELIFGVSSIYAIAISTAIVILYSSCGGIKAVTFTDLLQFLTFSMVLPLVCVIIWNHYDNSTFNMFVSLKDNALFDFEEVFSLNNPRSISSLSLLMVLCIPSLGPCYFQRLSMSKGVMQAKSSFIVAGLIIMIITALISYIGVLILSTNPNLNPDYLLPYMLETYTFPGFKGLIAICIVAIIMSTADSFINSASILLSHDIIVPLNIPYISSPKKELLLLRIVTVLLGLSSFAIANYTSSILNLFVKCFSFYAPIVSTPLLLAIFGFRSNAKVVWIGIISGIIAVPLWIVFGNTAINEGIIGMLANILAFSIAHNLYGRPNNFRNNDDYVRALNRIKITRSQNLQKIKEFDLNLFMNKLYSYKDNFYRLVGVFCITSVLLDSQFIPVHIHKIYRYQFYVIYSSTLIISSALIILPFINYMNMRRRLINIYRMVAMPYLLIFIPTTINIISNYENTPVVIFILGIIIYTIVAPWQFVLICLSIISYISMKFCNLFLSTQDLMISGLTLKFKLIGTLLITATALIALFKPKQDEAEIAEEKVNHLSDVVEDQNSQILQLSALKQTFLMNLQHETNTPITGVYSMSQALQDCYDKLSDEERKKAIATIAVNSERLISYANNLIDVSKLMSSVYKPQIRSVNLSSMLEEILRKCKKLYIAKDAEEDREFEIEIESGLQAMCDEYYIRKSFENLIINSIQYCKKA